MLNCVFVLAALVVGGTTAATVDAVCEPGPKVTFTITGATSGFTVYGVDTGCASAILGTIPYTYTMDTSQNGCTLPPSGTAFFLVIQQYSTFVSLSDEVFEVTCTIDLGAKVKIANVATTMLAESTTVSDTFGTIVTFEVVHDTTGVALTSVNVGQTVKLKVSIPQSDNALIGMAITAVQFKVGSLATTVLHMGCPANSAPFPMPDSLLIGSNGVLEVSFPMFFPVTAGNRPALSATIPTVDIIITVQLCSGDCASVTCSGGGRKRRSSDVPVGTDIITLTRPLVILPPGMSVVTRNETIINNEGFEARETSNFSTALIATVVTLGVVLALCISVLVIMFCRLRRHMDASDSKKSAFENKAYN